MPALFCKEYEPLSYSLKDLASSPIFSGPGCPLIMCLPLQSYPPCTTQEREASGPQSLRSSHVKKTVSAWAPQMAKDSRNRLTRLVRVGKLSQILYKVRSQIPQDCCSKLTLTLGYSHRRPTAQVSETVSQECPEALGGCVSTSCPYTVLSRTQAGAWHISLKNVPSYNGLSAVGSHGGQL